MDTTEKATRWNRVGALIAGQAVSLVGDSMLLVAVAWTAVRLGGTGAVTVLMLCSTVPKAVMLVFGGAVADLLGPRFVLLRTTTGRVVLLAVGAAAVWLAPAMPTLVVIALVEGTLIGLGGPSFGTVLPRLAKGGGLVRANSLYAMVTRLAPIAGAPLGAWLIAFGRLWPALAVVSGTCAVASVCLIAVTRDFPPPQRTESGPGLLHRSMDGLRLLADNRRLRWLFVSSFALDFAFNWPLAVALPLLADERAWGVAAVGTVIAAFSGGALTSAGLGALVGHRLPLTVRLVVTGVLIAAGILLMAMMPTIFAMAVVAYLIGLAAGFNGPTVVTLYQDAAPKERMGAAMATLALAGIGTAPVAIALFGGLALLVGVHTTWLVCGVVAFAAPVTALIALRVPEAAEEPEPQLVAA